MRKEEKDLVKICADQCAIYIKGKFDNKVVEKNLAANSYAHGYYIGWRWRESQANRKVFGFATPLTKPTGKQDLSMESASAVKWYMDRNFPGKVPDKELIASCARTGFEDGVRGCEGQA